MTGLVLFVLASRMGPSEEADLSEGFSVSEVATPVPDGTFTVTLDVSSRDHGVPFDLSLERDEQDATGLGQPVEFSPVIKRNAHAHGTEQQETCAGADRRVETHIVGYQVCRGISGKHPCQSFKHRQRDPSASDSRLK